MYSVHCPQPINQPSVHAEDNFIFCMYTYLHHCMTLTFGTEDHSTQQRRHFKERGGKRRDSRTSPSLAGRSERTEVLASVPLVLICFHSNGAEEQTWGDCCAVLPGGSGPCTARSVQPSSSPGEGISPASCPGGRRAPMASAPSLSYRTWFPSLPPKGCEYSKKLKRGIPASYRRAVKVKAGECQRKG